MSNSKNVIASVAGCTVKQQFLFICGETTVWEFCGNYGLEGKDILFSKRWYYHATAIKIISTQHDKQDTFCL